MENWKDIKGYEGLYVISDLGNIKNLKRGTLLKPCVGGKGYYYVSLSKNKICKSYSLHKLLAVNFLHLDCSNKLLVVDHIDNNKLNNNLNNLQIVSHRVNSQKYFISKNDRVGINFNKQRKKWRASIWYINRRIHLGYFEDKNSALSKFNLANEAFKQGVNLNELYPRIYKTN